MLVRLRGLVDACHPGPTVAVTTVVTLVALGAGRSGAGLAVTSLAVLTGQLSVGWSNDAYDATRDLDAGRTAKPTVRGDVTARILWRSAVVALAVCVLASYAAAGPVGGSAHLVAVASAWSYNLRLKATVWSWLPYAVSFGLVPAFVTYGLTPAGPPAAWVVVTMASMGVGAHLANAVPDLEGDTAVGAGGVVAALGPRRSTVLALALLMLALVLLVTHLALGTVAAALVLGGALGTAVVVAVRGQGQSLFRLVLVLAVLAVVLLVRSAGVITA